MEAVLVVGAGFMGTGIAQVCAQAGYRVYLTDKDQNALGRAMKTIQWSVEKLESKGLIRETAKKVLDRLSVEPGIQRAAEVQWVIEAVFEDEPLKKDLFRQLDKLASPSTPLATNTSGIPITRIASATQHPERVVGLHFFGPVPLMALVEVVKGNKTSDDIFDRAMNFIRSIGKTALAVRKDIPGFVINRILNAATTAALQLVELGIASPEDIDTGLRLSLGWNTGIFEICDNAGLDTVLRAREALIALGRETLLSEGELDAVRKTTTPVKRLVEEGKLGRKVGAGFYRYSPEGKRIPGSTEMKP